MAAKTVEQRLATLEAKVAELSARLDGKRPGNPWLDVVWGAFADDPAAHEEATRIGREWRESFRSKRRRGRKS